jgi:minor extracellular serine protease Vpr
MRPVLIGALALMMATPFNVLASGPKQGLTQSERIQEVHALVQDQVKALGEQDPVYIEAGVDTQTAELVNVIVELRESAAISKSTAAIKDQQNSLIQSLQKQGMNITVSRSFQKVFNGMALSMPGKKISELAANPQVKAIYEDGVVMATPIYSQDISDGAPLIGAHEMNDAGYKGEGMKVGVLDTGIDYLHPDLKDAYKGGYDFVENDNDPYETRPNRWGQETTHGTHVSGTIVGNNVSANGVRGVAPEADLFVYRVLGPGGSGSDSNVIAGIEKSVIDQMDVINLSLGNSQQHDPFSPSSIAVNNAILAGVTVVLSNGNSGTNGRGSVGSPASSDMAISVGASTLESTRFTGDVTITYPGSPAAQDPTKANFPVRVMAWNAQDGPEGYAKTLTNLPLVYVGEGADTDYKSNVKGKAVLITRGNVTFDEKIGNARKAGAVAAFIFDKDSKSKGPISYFLGAGDYVPTYSLSEEAGVELLNVMKDHPGEEFSLDFGTFQTVTVQGDEIAPFSSRGPTANMNIKPDVVAPGVNIRSTVAAYGGNYTDAYQTMNGTSMAAPHVAGLSVLLKQAHPEFTPFDVKAALMNTAKVLDTPKYTMFDQGAGRVQGLNALNTEALVMVKEQSKADSNGDKKLESAEHYTGSILFGRLTASDTETLTQKKTILLKDVAGKAQDYAVRYQFIAPESTNNVTLSTPAAVHVDANGEASFDVSIHVPAATPDGEYQGYLYLTNTETGAELHMPFISYVGEAEVSDGFSHIDVKNPHFSPDGNGVLDTLPITFGLTNKAEVVFAELFDSQTGSFLGTAFGYVADAEHPALEAGEHTFEWDGTYLTGWSDERFLAPEGTYTMALVGFAKIPDSVEAQPFIKWMESDLFLQTKTPTVVVKETDYVGKSDKYHLKGHIEDLYTSNGRGDQVKVMYSLRNVPDDFNQPHRFEDGFFFANADGSFEVDIKVFPGLNFIQFGGTSPAFDYGPGTEMNNAFMQLHVGHATQFITAPNRNIALGEEFSVTVDARFMENFIGGDLGFMVDDESMQFLGAEATEEVKQHGDVSLVVKDLGMQMFENPGQTSIIGPGPGPGPVEPSEPMELHAYKVALALKGQSDGIDGDIPYIKLNFKATRNIEKVNQHYPIFVTEGSLVKLNNGKEEMVVSFVVDGDIVLYAPKQKIVGHVDALSPEAFESGADYTKKGIKVFASWGGYMHPYTNEYMGGTTVEGVIHPDGSFVIEGLPADQSFTVRLFVPGHLPAVMDYLQLLQMEDGVYVSSDVQVQWENKMLAGNVNQDNVIDLLDLVIVSRNFGLTGATAVQGDINLDGTIDILDLSYVTANYDKRNENLAGWGISVPIPQLP